jgi:hypothetical protein
MPAPTAGPLTAATVGSGDRSHAQEPFVDRRDGATLVVGSGACERAETRHVGARTERGRLARDHDGGRRLVGFERVERRDDLVDHRGRHRVASLDVDEGDDRDRVAVLHTNVLHDVILSRGG